MDCKLFGHPETPDAVQWSQDSNFLCCIVGEHIYIYYPPYLDILRGTVTCLSRPDPIPKPIRHAAGPLDLLSHTKSSTETAIRAATWSPASCGPNGTPLLFVVGPNLHGHIFRCPTEPGQQQWVESMSSEEHRTRLDRLSFSAGCWSADCPARLAVGTRAGSVVLWDLALRPDRSGLELRVRAECWPQGPPGDQRRPSITALQWGEAGLAVGADDGSVCLLPSGGGPSVWVQPADMRGCVALAWRPGDQAAPPPAGPGLAVVGRWDNRDAHPASVTGLSWSCRGLHSASTDGTSALWALPPAPGRPGPGAPPCSPAGGLGVGALRLVRCVAGSGRLGSTGSIALGPATPARPPQAPAAAQWDPFAAPGAPSAALPAGTLPAAPGGPQATAQWGGPAPGATQLPVWGMATGARGTVMAVLREHPHPNPARPAIGRLHMAAILQTVPEHRQALAQMAARGPLPSGLTAYGRLAVSALPRLGLLRLCGDLEAHAARCAAQAAPPVAPLGGTAGPAQSQGSRGPEGDAARAGAGGAESAPGGAEGAGAGAVGAEGAPPQDDPRPLALEVGPATAVRALQLANCLRRCEASGGRPRRHAARRGRGGAPLPGMEEAEAARDVQAGLSWLGAHPHPEGLGRPDQQLGPEPPAACPSAATCGRKSSLRPYGSPWRGLLARAGPQWEEDPLDEGPLGGPARPRCPCCGLRMVWRW
ncbi:hypothetical protein PAPYR_3471 [Paratrimastix pyriformis]|uniref:Uncharacterized protein n=1 Tax=Paratrimastix pyriformis TaxID=342808 RepID=A0ABQ8UMN1_9EUKA|nr:hypothetical protein PAPYR_3471 [Paratrimastix pyriformis]